MSNKADRYNYNYSIPFRELCRKQFWRKRVTSALWDISQTGLTIAAILTNVAKVVRRGVVLLGPSLTRSPDAEKCLWFLWTRNTIPK